MQKPTLNVLHRLSNFREKWLVLLSFFCGVFFTNLTVEGDPCHRNLSKGTVFLPISQKWRSKYNLNEGELLHFVRINSNAKAQCRCSNITLRRVSAFTFDMVAIKANRLADFMELMRDYAKDRLSLWPLEASKGLVPCHRQPLLSYGAK